MPDSIAEAAYDLALRAIDQQERRLNELRSRTGTLIAAASVAASFLGAQAARSSDLDLASGLAVIGYLVCVGAALYVLLPHRLVLEFRGSAMLDAVAEVDHVTVEEALRAASGWIERFHESKSWGAAASQSLVHRRVCWARLRDCALDR